jgi:hypothetical protein
MKIEQRVSTCKLNDVNDLLASWNAEDWVALSISTSPSIGTKPEDAHTRVSVLFQRTVATA